jgi:hypothetical protein
VIIDDDSVKLPKSVSNFLILGFRIIGRAPVSVPGSKRINESARAGQVSLLIRLKKNSCVLNETRRTLIHCREPKAEIPPIPGPLETAKFQLTHLAPLNARKVEAALAAIAQIQASADVGAEGKGGDAKPPKTPTWEETLQALLEATAPLTPVISANPLKQARNPPNINSMSTQRRLMFQNLSEEDDPRVGGQWRKTPCWAAGASGPPRPDIYYLRLFVHYSLVNCDMGVIPVNTLFKTKVTGKATGGLVDVQHMC